MGAVDFRYSNVPFGVSCAFDAAVVLAAVVWAGRGRRPVLRLVVGAIAAGVVLLAKGVAMGRVGLAPPFGVAHVAWLDLVVVAPLAGLAVLASRALRARKVLLVAAVLALALAPLGAYASFVEPGRLEVERTTVTLPAARTGSHPVRVVVVADLQFERLGPYERRAVQTVEAQHPDLILVAGDIHQGSRTGFERQLPAIHALLSRMRAPGGTFAVQGDQEGVAKARRIYAGTGIHLLSDRQASTRVEGRRIAIAGLALNYRSARAGVAAKRLDLASGAGDIRILLAHRPDAVYRLPPHPRVDLTVAGHTHGGQIKLPLIGPLQTASHVPREVGGGGLHELDGRRIYVSRGIGVERGQAPRVRLGDRPEISVLTLR